MQGFERMDRQLADVGALAGHLVPAGSMFAFLAGAPVGFRNCVHGLWAAEATAGEADTRLKKLHAAAGRLRAGKAGLPVIASPEGDELLQPSSARRSHLPELGPRLRAG